MNIRDGVYAYDLPWGWGDIEEALSVAIVETGEATVLFGTGDDSTADDLRAVVQDHTVDVAVAEHGDVDHFGGIPALREEFDLTVAIPAGDTQFLDDAGVHYDVEMEAGETYWGFETIGVPGHTPDNLAYLYEDVLLAGDAVCGSDSAFAMDGDWPGALAPLADDFNADTAQTLESVSLLTGNDVETVLTAHGQNVLEDGEAEIATLVEAIDAMDR
ncbi:MAG: MBL fold metallo-hydrolase [Halobacteriota archaeon]